MNTPSVKILHIEDDDIDAMLVRDVLHSDVGYGQFEIIHVNSLRDALKELSHNNYDTVLLDLNLRDVQGIDSVSVIKEESPDIPVVVISGVDSDSIALNAIDCGAQEYIAKGHCSGRVIRHAIHSSIKCKAVERELFKQANYDELTGLSNRRFFMEYLQRTLDKAKRWKRSEVILFLDLDRFKIINDHHGHEFGNMVLREAAARMIRSLRSCDIIARYGGDEFVILLDSRSDNCREAATKIANKIIASIGNPFDIDGHHIEISSSIGIAVYPESGTNCNDLIKYADEAMYQSKNAGGGCYHFSES